MCVFGHYMMSPGPQHLQMPLSKKACLDLIENAKMLKRYLLGPFVCHLVAKSGLTWHNNVFYCFYIFSKIRNWPRRTHVAEQQHAICNPRKAMLTRCSQSHDFWQTAENAIFRTKIVKTSVLFVRLS